MPNVKCRYCHSTVPSGTTHQCRQMREAGESAQVASDDSSDFFVSLIVGAATDSTLLGTLAGGDIIGAALGDLLGGDD